MSGDSAVLHTSGQEHEGNRGVPCPLYGCKRVYADTSELEIHIKDHEIPAQSLPGKVLLCSIIGCSGSFPDMQQLVEHMRHHHKPNIFFQCESCRTKLRSYRGLLTHLHTCSKVPRGKTKPSEAMPAQLAAGGNPNILSKAMEPEAASTPSQTPHPDGSLPALPPDPAASPQFRPLETSPPQLTEVTQQLPLWSEALDLPPSLNLEGHRVAPEAPDSHSRSPESAPPPHSSPGSAAVWKKNQGVTCSRRILWEHTRGRYTCVQCGHIVTNRKEMTQHISNHHSGSRAAEEAGSSTPSTKH